MSGQTPVWRRPAVITVGVIAVVGVAIALGPMSQAMPDHSPEAASGDPFTPIQPDVPVVIDAADARILAAEWLPDAGPPTRVDGPIQLPARAGPHWVVTFADGTQLVVGLLLGNVARLDVAMLALLPPPVPDTRLTIREARELAAQTFGGLDPGADSNASIDLTVRPGGAVWCGNIPTPDGVVFTCVDLVTRLVYNQPQAENLIASGEELRGEIAMADSTLQDATAAYRLIRALGAGDRVIGVSFAWNSDLEAAGVAAGLETVMATYGPGVVGPWERVLAVLADLPPSGISLEEDRDALRGVPDDQGPRPQPGLSYVGWPGEAVVQLAGSVEMQPELVALALDRVAATLRPADGQPYDRLYCIYLCDLVRSCHLSVFGTLAGAGEDRYEFQVTEGEPLRLVGATYEALPRPMVQEAERIARADPATAALIGEYETIARASWDPADPGRVTLVYARVPPVGALAAGAMVAATSVFEDRLFVTVDLVAERVIDTHELLAGEEPA